jgi:hypothetical protein
MFVLLDVSVAVQTTRFVPTGNVEPLGGTHTMLFEPQLSVPVTMKVTLLFEHSPASALATILLGQVIPGACVSKIVIVNEHAFVLPEESETEQFTVVAPFGNVAPEAGLHTGVPTPGQLSEAVTTNVTLLLLHRPASATPTALLGQLMAGCCKSSTMTVKPQLFVLPVLSSWCI